MSNDPFGLTPEQRGELPLPEVEYACPWCRCIGWHPASCIVWLARAEVTENLRG